MISLTCKNFDIKQIAASGQCFRMRRMERIPADMADFIFSGKQRFSNVSDSGADRAVITGDDIICYEVPAGDKRVTVAQISGKIENTLFFDCSQSEWDNFWADYFDMDTDYGAIISSIDPGDEYLTAAAASCPGIRILKQDPWEMLVTFLISQQNNIPRITKSVQKLCEHYGEKIYIKQPENIPAATCHAATGCTEGTDFFYAFPTPEALAGLGPDDLMREGLGYRSKYVVKCARAVLSGEFAFPIQYSEYKAASTPVSIGNVTASAGSYPDGSSPAAAKAKSSGICHCAYTYEEAKKLLLTLYGVGPKVADCICLFGLHLVDAFPIDTHIRQILRLHYPEGFPQDRYPGVAGILQQYMFYYDLLQKNKA